MNHAAVTQLHCYVTLTFCLYAVLAGLSRKTEETPSSWPLSQAYVAKTVPANHWDLMWWLTYCYFPSNYKAKPFSKTKVTFK